MAHGGPWARGRGSSGEWGRAGRHRDREKSHVKRPWAAHDRRGRGQRRRQASPRGPWGAHLATPMTLDGGRQLSLGPASCCPEPPGFWWFLSAAPGNEHRSFHETVLKVPGRPTVHTGGRAPGRPLPGPPAPRAPRPTGPVSSGCGDGDAEGGPTPAGAAPQGNDCGLRGPRPGKGV